VFPEYKHKLQLRHRADDDDATRSGAILRLISIRRRKTPQVLLSQRRAFKVFTIVPILQLGQIGDDGDATCSGSS